MFFRFALVLIPLVVACSNAPVLQIELIPTGSLILERDLVDDAGDPSSLNIFAFDVTAGAILFNGEVPLGSIDTDVAVSMADAFVAGNQVAVTVQGVSRACERRGRVVGRSFVTEWTEDGAVFPVQLGCANEIGVTPTEPQHARIGHNLITTPEGTAILAGGSGAIDFGTFGVVDLVSDVEEYDPRTGRFETTGTLASPRSLAAAALTPAGEVALFGGLGPACLSDFEVAYPESRTGAIDAPRCAPSAAAIEAGVALVGGNAVPHVLSDATLSGYAAVDGAVGMRNRPSLVSLGEFVLIAGGSEAPGTPALQFVGRCQGSPTPCAFAPTGDLPPADWSGGAAVLTGCAAGSGGGAVYLLGGETGGVATDRAWCLRLEEDRAEVVELAVGLAGPRTQHLATPVVSGESVQILVAGGLNAGGSVRNAELYDAEGCSCEPLQRMREPIPLPAGGEVWSLSQLTTLGDGSVLIVGGARGVSGAPTLVEGIPYAALFIPDL